MQNCVYFRIDNDTKNLSKLFLSTVTSPKCTKWLIVMDTDRLGGLETDNETTNLVRCTLGGTMLNWKLLYNLKSTIIPIKIF